MDHFAKDIRSAILRWQVSIPFDQGKIYYPYSKLIEISLNLNVTFCIVIGIESYESRNYSEHRSRHRRTSGSASALLCSGRTVVADSSLF